MSDVTWAVGVASAHGETSATNINARMQEAMTEAVKAAQAEGITDPEAIRARILAARDAVLSE